MSYSSLNQNVTWMKNRQPVCMLQGTVNLKPLRESYLGTMKSLAKHAVRKFLWVWKNISNGSFGNQSVYCCWTQPEGLKLNSFSSYLSDFDMHKLWAAGTVGFGFIKDVCFIDPKPRFCLKPLRKRITLRRLLNNANRIQQTYIWTMSIF